MYDSDELDRRTHGRTRDTGDGGYRSRDADFGEQGVRRLYLDPERRRIAGVCAGIARYYGVEPWVVRLVAVTALLFFPGIVFPAYWVAYFVMERPPGSTRGLGLHGWARHQGRGAYRRARRDVFSSPAPELGPRLSPRRGLRDVKADLNEIELRLRRMEAHVTSGRYELQRELHMIDPGTAR
jgi:phage shock protein C